MLLFMNDVEVEFSEVRIAPIQHPLAPLAEIDFLRVLSDFLDFLIISIGRGLRHGGSLPIGTDRTGAERPVAAPRGHGYDGGVGEERRRA